MRLIRSILVLSVIVALGCGGSTALRSGKVYLQKNRDFPKAEEMFRQAIEEDPTSWEAHFYLALALAEQGKYSEASREFTKARELVPEKKKDMVEQSQRHYFAEHYNRGINAISTRNYKRAVDELEKAVAIYPQDPKGYINLGVAYSNIGDEEKALESFKNAVQADSTSAEAWRNLGISYQAMGQFELARDAYEKVVSLKPDDPEGLFSLGDMYFNLEDYEKALQNYEKAAEELTDAALEYQIGACYFKLKKYENAAMAFQKSASLAQNKEPDIYQDALYNLGVSYLRMDEYDAAIATFERLLTMQESAEIHEMLGAAYSKKGMKEKAIEEFGKAEELRSKK